MPDAGEGALGSGKRVLLCLLAAWCCPSVTGKCSGMLGGCGGPTLAGKASGDSLPSPAQPAERLLPHPVPWLPLAPYPPYSSGCRPRSCRALRGCWWGHLPPTGNVPWAWERRDPVSCGKGCTIVTLLLCPVLVVPDPGQGQEKVALHPVLPLSPHPWSNTNPNPFNRVPPFSCSWPVHGQGGGEPFWDCPAPQSSAWG